MRTLILNVINVINVISVIVLLIISFWSSYRYALRKSKEIVKRGFHEFERHYIPACNALECLDYDSASDHLDKAREIWNDQANYTSKQLRTEHKVIYLYARGAVMKEKKLHKDAEQTLLQCVNVKGVKDETYAIPFALVTLAELYLELDPPKLHEANIALQKSKTFGEFDFDNLFSYRCRRMDTRLAKAQKRVKQEQK
tara:strand:+ start:46 stop:639 length:594 start_codon:yes stop_codon:yes gene_type:complete